MKSLFKDTSLQSQLEKNGFIVLPMLSQKEIEILSTLFDDIRPDVINGIYSNVHGNSRENNLRVDHEISYIFSKYANELFCNFQIGGGTFLVKGANLESASTLHQDWNSIDEIDSLSVSMWCPLVDVDENNGCLQVIPGSHNFFQSIRSITIPSVYLDFDNKVQPYVQSVPMKAGDVCIYAHSLFHGSKPNYSGKVRVAAVTGILPTDRPQIHYYNAPGNTTGRIDVYEIDMEFYYEGLLELRDGQVPKKFEKIGEIEHNGLPLNKDHVYEIIRKNAKGKSPKLIDRLKKMLALN